MEHRELFTEEMLRQMYQRRGYQVMRLCGEVSADRQKTMELTFQAFGEAHRQLSAAEQPLTVAYQDEVLLNCTRRVIQSVLPDEQETIFQPEAEPLPASQPAAEEEPLPAEPEELPELPAMEDLPIMENLQPEEPPFDQPEEPAEQPTTTMVEKFNAMQSEAEAEPLDLTDTSGSSFGWGLLVCLLVLIILGLLWAIWGVAQNLFPLPQLDLGYQWFNANVYPLF